MGVENTHVEAVADAIRRYLRDHPNAADTLQGVATWWLAGHTDIEWLTRVREAVELLVKGDELKRRTLRDGTVIYERNKEYDGTR
jgi:hypothetical protein